MSDPKRKVTGASAPAEASGQPQAKRQRVSRACDQCRTAREKCDGIQPRCFTCASTNRSCSYTVNPKKRGIQPGYIKSLEIALAWTFSNVSGSEEALRALLSGSGQGLVTGKDTDGINKLQKRWRKSIVCKDIDRLLSGSDGNVSSVADPTSPDSGNEDNDQLNTAADIAMLTPSSIAVIEKGSTIQTQPDLVDLRSNLSPTPKSFEPAQRSPDLQKAVLPSNLWDLIDIYYAYTHCWLPIVEKPDLLKAAYSYPEDGLFLPQQGTGAGRHAELWSVLAFASFQATTVSVAEKGNSVKQKDLVGATPGKLYERALSHIPSYSGPYELGHATSLLLSALIEIGSQNFDTAWLLIGHAVRITCLLLRATKEQPEEDRRGKRVSWACFILDSFVSAHLNMQPHLKRFHLDELGPIDEDGIDEWHAWVGIRGFGSGAEGNSRSPVHALSTFNRLAMLASILNDAVTSRQHHGQTRIPHELQQWRSSLPESCNFAYLGPRKLKGSPSPPLLHLGMAYAYVGKICLSEANTIATSESHESSIPTTVQRYIDTFGTAALPPLAGLYMATTHNYQDVDRAALISSALRRTWGRTDSDAKKHPQISLPRVGDRSYRGVIGPSLYQRGGDMTSNHPLEFPRQHDSNTSQLHHPQSTQALSDLLPSQSTSTTRSSMQPPHRSSISSFSPRASFTDLPSYTPNSSSTNVYGPDTSLPTNNPNDSQMLLSNSSNIATIYDTPISLDRYSKSVTTDIDALFDELASLDGTEGSANQPQFMQNLGFAPDMNLTEVLESDYGQFDPFSVYMQHTGFETPASDPVQPAGRP